MGNLDKLFHPRGVAVVGASRDLNRGGGQPVKALLELGYKGGVYPINPKCDEIGGVRCYHSLQELDQPCDVAVIALPARFVIDAVKVCGAKKIGFAVIYGGGFREAGSEGLSLERLLLETARANGVRLIGPNCLGVVNITDRVYAAFGSMTREPLLKAGNVSMVYQSGGFGHTLAMRSAEAGAGFRYLVASGNETDITTPELIDHYLDDQLTKVVISYVEGISDGRALMAMGQKAVSLGKPILLWKAGRKEQGLRAAASHTASMTGRYEIYKAAFEQSGIIEVRDLDEVASLVQAFSSGKLPQGRRVGVLSASGGSAIVFADTCDDEGLQIPALSSGTVSALLPFAPSASTASNPLDFAAGFLNDAVADKFAGAADLMFADANVDQICFMLGTLQGKPALNGARIVASEAKKSAKPILVFSSAPPAMTEEARKVFAEAHIPVLSSPIEVAHVAAVTVKYAEHIKQMHSGKTILRDLDKQRWNGKRTLLNEMESKELLASHGLPVTRELRVACGAAVPVGSVPYPAVAKILSRDLPHKSDVGGVELNIRNESELKSAFEKIYRSVERASPSAKIEGMLVSEMVSGAVEVIVGVINDDVFGPTVLLGLGGTLTEVLHDVVYRVAPFDVAIAQHMISSLRGTAIFNGVRGQSPRDVDALAHAVSRVSEIAWDLRARMVELDINPLFVKTAGEGVVIGDALAVMLD